MFGRARAGTAEHSEHASPRFDVQARDELCAYDRLQAAALRARGQERHRAGPPARPTRCCRRGARPSRWSRPCTRRRARAARVAAALPRRVLAANVRHERQADEAIAERLGISKRTVEREMQAALDACQRELRGGELP